MISQITFVLAHPVFDPRTQILTGHYWWTSDRVSAALTAASNAE